MIESVGVHLGEFKVLVISSTLLYKIDCKFDYKNERWDSNLLFEDFKSFGGDGESCNPLQNFLEEDCLLVAIAPYS